jgi:hypothetical protein
MMKFARYSSSLAKLWIKHNGNQAIKVSTAGCLNISDLAKAIKKELSPTLNPYSSAQLTLHKTLADTPLEPDFLLSSISCAGQSAKLPLFVKTPESIPTTEKTIFIQDIDIECRPIDSFTEVVVENDNDLKDALEEGTSLYQSSNPKIRIAKFKQLINGERYYVYSPYAQFFAKYGIFKTGKNRRYWNV